MVVQAKRVVAAQPQLADERLGALRIGEIGVSADVDPEESSRHTGRILELEVAATRHDAREAPGRRVFGKEGEVESAALHDLVFDLERNPVGAARNYQRLGSANDRSRKERKGVGCFHETSAR